MAAMFSFFKKTAPAPAPDEAPILLPEGWVTKPASPPPPPPPPPAAPGPAAPAAQLACPP